MDSSSDEDEDEDRGGAAAEDKPSDRDEERSDQSAESAEEDEEEVRKETWEATAPVSARQSYFHLDVSASQMDQREVQEDGARQETADKGGGSSSQEDEEGPFRRFWTRQ